MLLTCGSVGDVISVSLLVKDLLLALDSSKGSSAEYRKCVRELYILDTALLQVERLSRTHSAAPEVYALWETARHSVDKCRISVASFTDRIRKYGKSLATGGSGNSFKDAARKVQWQLCEKDEVARFRVEVAGYSNSINMLVATASVALLKTTENSVKSTLDESSTKTEMSLTRQDTTLKDIQDRLETNRQLISTGNTMLSKMSEHLEWIKKLGSDLTAFMARIMAKNIAIYKEVLAIRTALTQIGRPLAEDPISFEDALGRIAPVHLRFITSWEAFEAVLEFRFQGKRGFNKVKRKQYALSDSATNQDVDRSEDWEDAFTPGQKIDMSLFFMNPLESGEADRLQNCPHCQAVSEEAPGKNTLCKNCNRYFCRIEEICEVGPLLLPEMPMRRIKEVRFGKTSSIESGPQYTPTRPPTTSKGSSHMNSKRAKKRNKDDFDEDGENSDDNQSLKDDIRGIKRVRLISLRIRYKENFQPVVRLRILHFSPAERAQYRETNAILRRTIFRCVGEVEKSPEFGLFQAILPMRLLCNHGTFQRPFSWRRRSYQDEREATVSPLGQNGEIRCSGCQLPMPILGSSRLGNGFREQCAHILCSECIEKLSTPGAGEQAQHCPMCVRWLTYAQVEGSVLAGDVAMPDLPAKEVIEDDYDSYFNAEGYSRKMCALIMDVKKDLWTTKRTLHLLSKHLDQAKIPYLRIDGGCPLPKRQAKLDQFAKDDERPVLIMTTDTGGFGLNPTCANRVFIVEPQWNPGVESQAIARTIRLGQENEVLVTRYMIKDTVEEEMVRQQDRKHQLCGLVLEEVTA